MLEDQQQPGRDTEVDDVGEGLIPCSRRSLSYADSASDKDLSLRTGHPRQLTAADDRAISIAPRLGSAGEEGQRSNVHTPDLADEALFQEAVQAAKGAAGCACASRWASAVALTWCAQLGNIECATPDQQPSLHCPHMSSAAHSSVQQ